MNPPHSSYRSAFDDGDALDYDVGERLVTSIRVHRLDSVNDSLGFLVGYCTEDRVLALQPRGRNGRDKELRAVGSLATPRTRIRHREHIGLGKRQLPVNLVVELVTGSTNALAERVSALKHELLDDAVKDNSVVEQVIRHFARCRVRPLLRPRRESCEVRDRLGCVVSVEVERDRAEIGLHGGNGGVK